MPPIELKPSRPHRPNLVVNIAVIVGLLRALGYLAHRSQVPDEFELPKFGPVDTEYMNGRRSDFIYPELESTQTPDPIQDPANRDCATIDSSRPADPDPNHRHATTIIEAILLETMGAEGLDLPPYWYTPIHGSGRRVDNLEEFDAQVYRNGDQICVLKPNARRAIPTPESGTINSRAILAKLQNEQSRRQRRNGLSLAKRAVVFRGRIT